MMPGAIPDPVLELDNLVVKQGERALLSGLNCQVASGELVAVVGPSGCGKTTLLRTVAGLIGRGEGLRLAGQSPQDVGWPQYRHQVLLVAQQPALLAGTVHENLARPFSYEHVTGQFDTDKARALMDRLNLQDVALDAPARELSVGQQQRICLVRALLMVPKVLLLDEPTSALDGAAATKVEAVLREAARTSGISALIVTHDPIGAQRWCDRVLDLAPYLTEVTS